ncbi:MAG TPA: head decoration protein [Rhizomicrobium sp.]|jgi:hypothetical protein
MTLTNTNYGDNAFQPTAFAETYVPDRLIAGNLKLVTEGQAVITGAAAYVRGTVMGKVLGASATSAAKSGGNTGNGTSVPDATDPALAGAQEGIYKLVCTVASTNAATFRLYDPKGEDIKDYLFSGSGASFTTDAQIKVVVTDGATDFVVGDEFDINLTLASSKYKLAVKTATDGSQFPEAILIDAVDATAGDVNGGVYLTGEFNANYITYDASFSLEDLRQAFRGKGIFIKSAVSAADPS